MKAIMVDDVETDDSMKGITYDDIKSENSGGNDDENNKNQNLTKKPTAL